MEYVVEVVLCWAVGWIGLMAAWLVLGAAIRLYCWVRDWSEGPWEGL